MSLIGSKRAQQGVFEALASQNRAAGSGGGSGFQPMQLITFTTNPLAQTMTSTPYTDVPQLIVNFPVSYTANYMVVASWYGKISASPTGNFAFFSLRLGTASQVNNWGGAVQIFDKANGGFVNGSTIFVTTLAPGNQSAALQCGVDAGISALVQSGLVAVFQLGY